MLRSLVLAVLVLPVGGIVSAAELRGADIVTAFSGRTFACEDKKKEKQMKIVFPKLNPATKEVPYTYTLEGKTYKNAYVLRSNGRMSSKQSGQSRRVVDNGNNYVTIYGRSGQYWLCKGN